MTDNNAFWLRNRSDKAQRKIRRQAKLFGVDHRGLNVLFNASTDLDAFDPALVEALDPPPEDLEYAVAAGLARHPRSLTHDEVIAELQRTIVSIDRETLVSGFVASLRSGRFDLQSSLGSYAFHLCHPTHAPQLEVYGVRKHLQRCTVCGLRGASGETTYRIGASQLPRMRGGGIAHGGAAYALDDLTWFAQGAPVEASEADWRVFRQVLDAIRALAVDAQLTQLAGATKGLVMGTKYDRQRVLEVLGFCGVLRSRARPDVLGEWFAGHRDAPSHFYKQEWRYPVSFWTGADGVDEEAVSYWFPRLGK
jgi:hypothetical protein